MSALTALRRGPSRRLGPPALIAAALLFGVLSVGDAWIVARHLRNDAREDRKSTRLNSSYLVISYAVFCLKINVTDSGNLSSQATVTINVVDSTPPSVACPAPFNSPAIANCQSAVPVFLSGRSDLDACTPA